ncbi:MAG: GGDEF domain-containing protein [Undibacterium sp.]|nr:GGDEF domain-containing protein [Undibacterium sp.]
MNKTGFAIFPPDEPKQEIRLRRFFIGTAAHAMNITFVLLCWALGYLGNHAVGLYLSLDIGFVLAVYFMIRSGMNKRFKDPSLTFIQISVPAVLGLFVMFFAGEARSTFLLLGVTMFAFGMFRFKIREFIQLAIFILLGYALLIVLLVQYSPHGINLKFEILQWLAFAVTLIQFSFLAGFIGNLRRAVGEKNLELAQQNAELEIALQRISDMAIRDELTGVYNRRYLMERIAEEAQRCTRYGSVFSICMVDIDFFKKVNDTYGHLAGDEVLRSVATSASKTLRTTDFFGRFGGEEFVIALINTPMEGAMVIAERVRQQIESLTFPEIDANFRVTISIGVAEHVRRIEPAHTLKQADDALYRAKESGRNTIVGAPLSQ